MKYPSYLALSEKELKERKEKAYEILKSCILCPRECRVNRLEGKRGFCRVGKKPIVSSFAPHFGEERCLVGRFGSGTIFFTFCNLSCVYCQNYEISQLGEGREIEVSQLAWMMISLQKMGCHNINLVTPTHQVPQIIEALILARKAGLKIPIVYNTNAYEKVETLKLLEGIVDIYMPDFKYSDNKKAEKYSSAPNYFEIAKLAIKEMHRQVGDLKIKEKADKDPKNLPPGVAVRGLLVRHLVLPNDLSGTEKIIDFLAKEISPNTAINIMDQYRPCFLAFNYPELSRRISPEEYKKAYLLAKKAGLRIIN